jgi:uncharacterized protein YukE
VSGALTGDPDALRAGQPGIEVLADRVNAALGRLGTVLDAEGACWGGDETGQAFGDRYHPAERQLRAAFVRLAGRLHEVGDALTAVADVLDAANQRARERMS